MAELTPPTDPFAQPPAAAPSAPVQQPEAAAAPKTTPWKLIVGAVAAIAVVVVGVMVFTGDDDSGGGDAGGSGGDDASGAPAEVHVVGIGENDVTVYDANGANPQTLALPEDFRPLFATPIGRWLVEDTEGTSRRAVDLTSGDVSSFELPDGATNLDRGTLTRGGDHVVYFDTAGGSIVLVDLATGSVSSLGTAGERYFVGGGRHDYNFYVSADSPSTVVVPLADPASAWEVPGNVADIQGTETLVVTRTADGFEVAHYSGGERQGTPAEFAQPLITGLLTTEGATMIDTGGGLWSFSFADGSRENLGPIGIGIDAGVSLSADRMMAWGSAGTVLVDAAGSVVVQVPVAKDADGEQQPLVLVPGGLGSTCITLQPGQRPRFEQARAVLFDLAAGEVLLKMDATPFAGSFSSDGCSFLSSGEPSELVVDGALVDLGVQRIQLASPDFTSVIVFGESEFQLVAIDSGASVPLPKLPYVYARF